MPWNVYTVGACTVGPLAASPFFSLYTAASQKAGIVELGFFNRAALIQNIQLVRTGSGTIASTSFLGMCEEPYVPSASSFSRVGTVITTVAASTGNVLRAVTLPNTIGAGVIWSWPNEYPLIVAACSGIALSISPSAAGSPLSFYIRWIE